MVEVEEGVGVGAEVGQGDGVVAGRQPRGVVLYGGCHL